MTERWDESGAEPRVSQDLARDLGSLFDAGDLRVPPAVSERILNRARARIIGRARRRRPRLPRWAGAAAAAAAVVVVAVWLNVTQPPRPTQTASAIPADIDGSGQVNILDALVLARQLDAGGAGARDVNHDGVVNQSDVDAIAMLAVDLRRGGTR